MSNSNKQEDKEEHQQDSSIDTDRIIAELIQALANEMHGKEVIAKVILEQNLFRLSDWDNLDFQAFMAPFARPTVYASIVLELVEFCGMKSRIKDYKKLYKLIVRLVTSLLIPKFSIIVSYGKKKMIEFCEDVLNCYDREYGLVVISDNEKISNSNKKKNRKKNTNKKVKHTVGSNERVSPPEVVISVPSKQSDVVVSSYESDGVKLQEEKVVSPNQSYEKMLMDVLTEKLDARISILETGITKLIVELREEVVVLRKEVQQLNTKADEQINLIQQLTTKAVEQISLTQQLIKKFDEQATAHEKEKILRDEQYKNLEERISRMMTTCNCGCSNCLKCANKQ